jgi:ATP-dependent Lon protease
MVPALESACARRLVSALTRIPVRAGVAMTGEITLRGEVLPIGGLKEKLLAAHRGSIATVLIPEENRKDLVEIPDNILAKLDVQPVRWIDQVLEIACGRFAGHQAPDGAEETVASAAPAKAGNAWKTCVPH